MSNDNNNNDFKNDGLEQVVKTYLQSHGKPVSRRELLGSGVIPFAASFALPNWTKMFANLGVAEAQDLVCTGAGASGLPAFVQLKLSGGWAASYNFIPHGEGGQMLSSYDRIGGGTGAAMAAAVVNNQFINTPMFYNQSGFLAGLLSIPQAAAAIPRTAFMGICVSSQDDSSQNRFGATGMVQKLGLKGSMLPSLGRSETVTGINALPALVVPEAPLRVGRLEDVIGALGVEGALATFSQPQKEKLFNTIKNLSSSQAASLQGLSGGATLSRLIQCANIANYGLVQNSTSQTISPLSNQQIATIFGINANTDTSSQNFVLATMVHNACAGNSGPVSFDMGGYDYHANPIATTTQRDNQAGQAVGRILASFAATQKPGFILICSDGSVASTQSDVVGAPFANDRGLSGAMYMLAYHPTRTVQVAMDPGLGKAAQQIGWLTPGQAAESTKVAFGNNPEKAAVAAFLNYCGFAGVPMAEYERVAGRVFDTQQVAAYQKLSIV